MRQLAVRLLLLGSGGLVDAVDNTKIIPSWKAAGEDHGGVRRLLLEKDSVINACSVSEVALQWIAAEHGHESTVSLRPLPRKVMNSTPRVAKTVRYCDSEQSKTKTKQW
jgi:hypothetical protein